MKIWKKYALKLLNTSSRDPNPKLKKEIMEWNNVQFSIQNVWNMTKHIAFLTLETDDIDITEKSY